MRPLNKGPLIFGGLLVKPRNYTKKRGYSGAHCREGMAHQIIPKGLSHRCSMEGRPKLRNLSGGFLAGRIFQGV